LKLLALRVQRVSFRLDVLATAARSAFFEGRLLGALSSMLSERPAHHPGDRLFAGRRLC